MRLVLYSLIKKIAQLAFFLYYKKVRLLGTEQIPQDRPLLFLPNHQNALLDPLVLAAFSKRKPYFLTRSDVFANGMIRAFFELLRMMPIYRLRDGRANLHKNQAIFDQCAELLCNNETLVLFPEGDHNIQRRVRSLSKGFTRILFLALDKEPQLDIALIPVGVNYLNASGFPDAAAFLFGTPLSIQDYLEDDRTKTIEQLKTAIYDQLKTLTTHIEDPDRYESIVNELDRSAAPYLEPQIVNQMLEQWDERNPVNLSRRLPIWKKLWDLVFLLFNLPVILIWRLGPKRMVPEIEFKTTFRFLYAVLAYPVFYLLLFLILNLSLEWTYSVLIVLAHALHNLSYVKLR